MRELPNTSGAAPLLVDHREAAPLLVDHREVAPLLIDRRGAAPLLVDRREAGRLLGVSPGTIDNLRLRGELPSVKIAARRLYDVADLRRFIDSRKGVGR